MNPKDASKDNSADTQPGGLAPETVVAPNTDSYNAFSGVAPAQPVPTNSSEATNDSTATAVDSPAPAGPTPPPSKKSRKKLFVIAGASSLALILLISGFVFGYYIPNQPANVYKTGMDRSGKALDTLTSRATDEKQLKTFEKTQATANIDVTAGDTKFSGKVESKFSASKIDGALTITSEPQNKEKQEASLKILSDLAKDHQFPDIYLQVTGLHSFGYDEMIPQLAQYEGKWISFNEDFIKSLGVDMSAFNGDKQITQADAVEIAKLASASVNKYVLNKDASKSVLENRKFVGKETSDGVKAYHYKVGINKANLKNTCKPLYDSITNTKIYQKISSSDKSSKDEIAKAASEAVKNCEDSADKVDTSKTFDMWIDSKTKLVQKIRLQDRTDPNTYADIGQNYQGGDKISFYVHYNSSKDKTDVKMTFDSDMKTSVSSGKLVVSTDGDNKLNINVDYTIKPYSGEIKVDKPAGSIPIQDVLSSLGLNTPGAGSEADPYSSL